MKRKKADKRPATRWEMFYASYAIKLGKRNIDRRCVLTIAKALAFFPYLLSYPYTLFSKVFMRRKLAKISKTNPR